MKTENQKLQNLIDTHAHLHMKHFEKDRDDVFKRVTQMKFVLNVSTSIEDLNDTIKIANILPNVFLALGIHPHDSGNVPNDYIEILENLALKNKKVLAIGEIGLDYFRNFSPIDTQKRVFAEQLMLANKLGKPVILHIRDAYEDVYEIIKLIGPENGGIVHAFSGDENWAKKFVKLGFKIGIGGPITYPKNDLLRNVVKIIGVENIVTETDCPYLPPQQYRGKRNEPIYVYYVFEQLNEIFGLDIDIYDIIWKNTKEILKINEDLANSSVGDNDDWNNRRHI